MKWEVRHSRRLEELVERGCGRWNRFEDLLLVVAVAGLLIVGAPHLTGVLDEPSPTASLERELRKYPAADDHLVRVEAGDGEATLYTTYVLGPSGRAEAGRLCGLVLSSSDGLDRAQILGRRRHDLAGLPLIPRLSACAPDKAEPPR